jgi:hypothetical protein
MILVFGAASTAVVGMEQLVCTGENEQQAIGVELTLLQQPVTLVPENKELPSIVEVAS